MNDRPRRAGSAADAPLAGKVAVVTGGTRGLGLAVAQALSAAGASVVAASRNADPSDPIDGITWDRVDVTDPQSVHELIQRTAEAFGGPHIAVANAGINRDGRIVRMSPDDWQATVNTNLSGVFHTIQAAAEVMQPQRAGRIITVSSCMASHPSVGTGAYAATKAAICVLTKVAALELGPQGILVNCVAPGILEGGMGPTVTDNPRLWAHYKTHLALGRPGEVEEIARLVAFLAGPDASYINGSIISADGGIAPWA